MNLRGLFATAGAILIAVSGCSSVPPVNVTSSTEVPAASTDPAETTLPTELDARLPEASQAATALSTPETTQEWCERVITESDAQTFAQRTGAAAPDDGSVDASVSWGDNGFVIMCSGGGFTVLAGQVIDEEVARQETAELLESALWQVGHDLEQTLILGGAEGTFLYLSQPESSSGVATFTSRKDQRAISMYSVSLTQIPPAESEYTAQSGEIARIGMALPFPVDPDAVACPVPKEGQTTSGVVEERILYKDAGIHTPSLEPVVSCAFVQSVAGEETGRQVILHSVSDQLLGESLEAAGWRMCDFRGGEYFLSDDEGQTIKFSIVMNDDAPPRYFLRSP